MQPPSLKKYAIDATNRKDDTIIYNSERHVLIFDGTRTSRTLKMAADTEKTQPPGVSHSRAS